jgi:hypothetical protein
MAAAVDWRFDRRLARFAEVILWKASIKMLFLMEISSYCCGWLTGWQATHRRRSRLITLK